MNNNSNEDDRIKEPTTLAIKFANAVFVFGILLSVLIAVYALYRIYHPLSITDSSFYHKIILVAGFLTTLFSLGLCLKNSLKVNSSMLLVTIVISVYGFESYLEFSHLEFSLNNRVPCELLRQVKAKQMGVPFDTRTIWEVLEQLNDAGIKAYLNELGLLPREHIVSNGFNTFSGLIFPLGGISNTTSIISNESGYYPIIETDEHGFNNPKGLYKKNKVDIMLLGDSFAEGYSVHSDETIAAVLRKPGLNVISLGKAGNGSLLNLATLIEYAKPMKPKIVLWLYFFNDLGFLEQEMKSPLLRKYLNQDTFSQNLITRQKEIDSVLRNYVSSLLEPMKLKRERELQCKLEAERNMILPAKRIITLSNIWIRVRTVFPPSLPPISKDNFHYILQKSKQMVSEWGGEMYFVYMPDYNRQSTGKEDSNREFALYTATKLKIPIIDIHKEVFAHHPDPLSLFPFRTRGHYTAEGYRLVAEAIANKLVVDDVLPTNSIKATQTLEELVNNLSTDDGRSNIDEMDEIEETLIQSLHETTIY